ncbi:MAG TPA: hypothetical protein VEQ36_10465 [Thermomicrobiales bacterium]|nr:hypothetical protein [Thermomicrobiales bacterium]
MKPTVAGIDALNRYLNGEWDFDQLYDWAITFGDRVEGRSDEQSMSIAGHVLVWIWEMNDGVRTQDEFDADLDSLTRTPHEVLARSA